jgi:hypothetical protein
MELNKASLLAPIVDDICIGRFGQRPYILSDPHTLSDSRISSDIISDGSLDAEDIDSM